MEYDAGNFWIALVGLAVILVTQLFTFAYLLGRTFNRIERLEKSDEKRDDESDTLRRIFDSKIDRVNAAIERQAEIQSNTAKMLAVYAERLDGYAKQLDLLREGGD